MTTELELVSLREQAAELCREVAVLVNDSSTNVEPPTCAAPSELTVVFVGPYNAGKSTIAKALTGLEDIAIGARPTTTVASTYRWRAGITIVDTPGVGTGRAEETAHDDATERAILAADQVVFVVSDEGFDDASAAYFKRLLPDRRVTGSLLLVVNKLGRTKATPEDLRSDLDRVLAPLTLDDQPTVFIDARSWLQARSSDDPARRAQLLERSRWHSFVDALDDMARRSGQRSRAVQPLHGARSALDQLIVTASTTDPEVERVAVLLRRRERKLRHYQQQASQEAEVSIRAAARRIEEIGDEFAERIEPGEPFDFDAVRGRADRDAQRIYTDDLHAQLTTTLEKWLLRAVDEIAELAQDPALAQIAASRTTDPDDPYRSRPRTVSGRSVRSLRGGFGDIGRFFTDNSSAGEAGHQIVYRIGKALGHKFKPWEAVKKTRFLGKIGKALGPLAVVTGMAFDVHDEVRAHQQRKDAADSRVQVRDAYSTLAADVARNARAVVDDSLADTFGRALERTAEMRAEQRDSIEASAEIVDAASLLQERLETLLQQASA